MNTDKNTNRKTPTDDQIAQQGNKKPELCDVPVDRLRLNQSWHRRDVEEGLDSLAQSIRKIGLLQFPSVMVEGDGYYRVVFGHRRVLSCKLSGERNILCHVIKATPKEAALLCYRENRDRKKLHPIDEALTLKDIKEEYGLTEAEVAAEVGLKQSTISELLSTLDLPKDIQEKINADLGPKTRFKFTFTHAVALAPLMRTDRFDRQFEVHELADKTITCELSSDKLEKLVQLFTGGDYDLLTEKLQMLVRKNKYMTPRMVDLFLHPEQFVEGNAKEAQLLRKRATELEEHERERFVAKAVNHRWSEEDIKNHLLKLLRPSIAKPENVDEDKQPSAAEMLLSDISLLIDKLEEGRYQVTSLAESDPDELPKIRNVASQLVCSLKRFMKTIETVAADTNITSQRNNANKKE